VGDRATVDEVVAELEERGYTYVEGLLSPDQVAAMRDELSEVLAATPTGRNDFEGPKTRRIYALFAKTRCFDQPAIHPLVLGVMERVLGHCHLSAPTGIEIGPGEVAQPLHFDDAIYPVPRPHQPLVLNTMWALDDFTEANGATRVVPGSHRWPNGQTATVADTVPVEMPAGSVSFYLGSIWHGGGANTTDRPRLGVILEYAASWLRQQETHLLSVPRSVARTLPEPLLELLGYNIRPPFIGYVDGRHPLRALRDESLD